MALTPAQAVTMRAVDRNATGADNGPVRLLCGIDLLVPTGRWVNLVGPSGSGKSSLLRLINRLDSASAGSIEVLGRPLDDWPVRELRRRVAMVFQEPTLLDRTVRENLALPFELGGGVPADFDHRARRTLAAVGLDAGLLDRDEHELSVGQKQRVALARALVTEPDMLLLDEPTAALDVRSAEQLLGTIRGLVAGHRLTVLMATHRLDEARRDDSDMVVMIGGRIEATGHAPQLVDDPPDGPVRRFLKGDA